MRELKVLRKMKHLDGSVVALQTNEGARTPTPSSTALDRPGQADACQMKMQKTAQDGLDQLRTAEHCCQQDGSAGGRGQAGTAVAAN